MTTIALILFLLLLFLFPTGYAIHDVFRQTTSQRVSPQSPPRADDMAIPPPAATWTALDEIQLTRVLLSETSQQQRSTDLDAEWRES